MTTAISNDIVINYVESPATILSFLSKVPPETKQIYHNEFSKIYKESEINPYHKNIIKWAITDANNIMRSAINDSYLYPDFKKWNICVVNSVLFNLPCTIADVIILPIRIVAKTDEFVITMIHEKIHVCQRYNPVWKTVPIDCWVKSGIQSIPYGYVKGLVGNNIPIICNPDTVECNDIWFYKKDGKLFYAVLVFLNGRVEQMWFEVGNMFVKCGYQVFQYEHPYEMVAYQLSEKIFRERKMAT
jgi:hypothetical protein